MDYASVVCDTAEVSRELLYDLNDSVNTARFSALSEVYCRYLEQNRKEAAAFYDKFSRENDEIVQNAMKLLDKAISIANVQVAAAALAILDGANSNRPDIYRAYYNKLFS